MPLYKCFGMSWTISRGALLTDGEMNFSGHLSTCRALVLPCRFNISISTGNRITTPLQSYAWGILICFIYILRLGIYLALHSVDIPWSNYCLTGSEHLKRILRAVCISEQFHLLLKLIFLLKILSSFLEVKVNLLSSP